MNKRGDERLRRYEKSLREAAIPTTSVRGSGRVNIPGIGEIRISGSGHISPEEIRVSGSGHLPGGFKVGRIRSSGSASIGGDIEADEMDFSGSASIMGSVFSERLTASGSFKADGGARGGSMRFSGSCRIRDEVELGDSLVVHGSFMVSGDVNAQNLVELDGSYDIGGKLTTSTFKSELSQRRSHVEKGIQADYVDVRKGRKVKGLVLFGRRLREGELHTTDIVGRQRVYLENVHCDNVTGKDVVMGEGCEVRGKVRYSGTVEVHPKANITNPPEKVD